mgnify:CR=1 FL=1
MYDHEIFLEEKLKEIAKESRVLDIGSGNPFQKRLAKYKNLFANVRYETLDSASQYNPTYVGDVHNLPLPDGSLPAVICLSVFEHLYDPQKASDEIYRALKQGGKALIYTHFIYPYHGRKGVYGDFFRFTEEGLRHLFRKFSKIEIKKQGGYFRAMGFFLPFQAKFRFIWEPITYLLDKLLKTENRMTTAGYYIYLIK